MHPVLHASGLSLSLLLYPNVYTISEYWMNSFARFLFDIYGDYIFLFFSQQDFTDLAVSSTPFVPTVTSISTSADLQWMIQQSNLISSLAPSYTSTQRSTTTLTSAGMVKIAGTKALNSRKRGYEQVIFYHRPMGVKNRSPLPTESLYRLQMFCDCTIVENV